MLFNRFCHAFQSCFNDAARHCKVQTNIPFRIADEQIIAAFQQNACVICKESGQLHNIRQAALQIHPGKIGCFGNREHRRRQMLRQIFLYKYKVFIQIRLKFRKPFIAFLIRRLMCSNGKRINKAYDFIPFAENLPQLCRSCWQTCK